MICTSDGKNFQESGFCPETRACFGPTKEDPFVLGFPSDQKHQLCVDFSWKGNYLPFLNLCMSIYKVSHHFNSNDFAIFFQISEF